MATTSIHIVDANGDPILLGADHQDLFMVIASQIFEVVIDRAEVQHSEAVKEPYVLNCQSYAIGLHMITAATAGQIHDVVVRGNPRTNSSLKTT